MHYLFLCLFLCCAVTTQASDPSLDEYLALHGYHLSPTHSDHNEGYMTDSQKKQFEERLHSYSHINTMVEIGLNGGHSAEMFFKNLPDLRQFVSFDVQLYHYTHLAKEYFEQKYKERFKYVLGNSLLTVPEYSERFPHTKYDLIYVDGCHDYEYAIFDILNCKNLAHPGTILWVDDYHGAPVKAAVDECVRRGAIRIDSINHSLDPCGDRCWVEAHYLFSDS